jgi:hypothetical protein
MSGSLLWLCRILGFLEVSRLQMQKGRTSGRQGFD